MPGPRRVRQGTIVARSPHGSLSGTVPGSLGHRAAGCAQSPDRIYEFALAREHPSRVDARSFVVVANQVERPVDQERSQTLGWRHSVLRCLAKCRVYRDDDVAQNCAGEVDQLVKIGGASANFLDLRKRQHIGRRVRTAKLPIESLDSSIVNHDNRKLGAPEAERREQAVGIGAQRPSIAPSTVACDTKRDRHQEQSSGISAAVARECGVPRNKIYLWRKTRPLDTRGNSKLCEQIETVLTKYVLVLYERIATHQRPPHV